MTPFLFLIEFEQYLRIEKRASAHTILAYNKDLESFFNHCGISDKKDLATINHHVIRSWIVALVSEGITSRSVNRKLSSLRAFIKFNIRTGVLTNDPMRKITGPRSSKRLPQFAKETELVKENTNWCFSEDFFGIRDQLMFELFYQTGIRLSELITIRENSLNGLSLKVLGKRNKERIIPIGKELHDLIKKYLLMRSDSDLENEYLLVTDKGDKLYPKFVYRKINNYLGKVTKLEQCSPHVLRHTFATHMLNNGAGLETLKELLGHASLSATQVYTHNSFAQLTHIYSQAHPRGHKKN